MRLRVASLVLLLGGVAEGAPAEDWEAEVWRSADQRLHSREQGSSFGRMGGPPMLRFGIGAGPLKWTPFEKF